jgi:hypothetical protein
MSKLRRLAVLIFSIAMIGAYYIFEGIANLIYWSGSHQPYIFTIGRFIRVVLGFYLFIIAVVMWVAYAWIEYEDLNMLE